MFGKRAKKQDIRKAVFDAKDILEEIVPLPEVWGGFDVLVRGLQADEIADYSERVAKLPAKHQSVELIMACVRDVEDGSPIFERADRDVLLKKGAIPFGEVLAACHRLSGFAKPSAPELDDLKGGGAAGSLS